MTQQSPRGLRLSYYSDTRIPMFIATQLLIAKSWKQPENPSADDWIKTLWYPCKMGYYPAIKDDIFETFTGK